MQVKIMAQDAWSGNMKKTLMRPAMAMVELIFALVIIGLTLMSAPAIISQSVQGSNIAMQQEAIAAAAAQITLIQSYYWDENGKDAIIGLTDAQNTNLKNSGAKREEAHTLTRSPTLGRETTDNKPIGTPPVLTFFPNDIDDFNGLPVNLKLYAGETTDITDNEGDYIDTSVIINNRISYVYNSLAPSSGTPTDIKFITVTLKSTASSAVKNTALEKDIIFKAFSCNIGKYTPKYQNL